MSEFKHVKGLADLQKFMNQLTPKLEANVMRGALRAGMKIVLPVAQANIHSVSGELAAGLKLGTARKGGMVMASIKAKGPHGFIAKFVEYGTAAHVIEGRNGGWLNVLGQLRKSVDHPGAKAKPFLRPALDAQAQNAVVGAAEYIKNRLATKEGLDTSAVRIEGDE